MVAERENPLRFKKCYCGCFTDIDEKRCPCCGHNPVGEEIYSIDEVVFLIRKGEVSHEKVFTKRPRYIYSLLERLR